MSVPATTLLSAVRSAHACGMPQLFVYPNQAHGISEILLLPTRDPSRLAFLKGKQWKSMLKKLPDVLYPTSSVNKCDLQLCSLCR